MNRLESKRVSAPADPAHVPVDANKGASAAAVTVIVPTVASRARGASLQRAIESIRSQQGVPAVALVVANGPHCDWEILGAAKALDRVRVVYQPEPGLPGALRAGRALVDTPFFAFLDDDDELLPNALACRLAALQADPSASLAVTAGDFVSDDGTRVRTPDIASVRVDPVSALIQGNWLASAAGLYRTEQVGEDVFARIPAYLEWTYVAVRLALRNRVAFVEEPTFVCHTGSPDSLSASKSYLRAQPDALRRIMELKPPRAFASALRCKYAAAWHNLSNSELREGNYWLAWRYHFATIARFSGLRYLSYTRHLIFASPQMIRGQRVSRLEKR
jgi:glycosyltransferase involved in cell wall biosynthesis